MVPALSRSQCKGLWQLPQCQIPYAQIAPPPNLLHRGLKRLDCGALGMKAIDGYCFHDCV